MADPGSERWKRVAAWVVGLLGAWAAVAGGLWAGRLFGRWARLGLGFARFCYLAWTLQLLRRCPDCTRLIRRGARVCHHCGRRHL